MQPVPILGGFLSGRFAKPMSSSIDDLFARYGPSYGMFLTIAAITEPGEYSVEKMLAMTAIPLQLVTGVLADECELLRPEITRT